MHVEATSTFQRRFNLLLFDVDTTSKCNAEATSTIRRRFLNVEKTSNSQCRFRLRFQLFFDVYSTTCSDIVSTLFQRRFAGWARCGAKKCLATLTCYN